MNTWSILHAPDTDTMIKTVFFLEMNELERDLSLMMIPAVLRHYWERLAPLEWIYRRVL